MKKEDTTIPPKDLAPESRTSRVFAKTAEERYQVRSKLGAGGMATVYDAVDRDLRRHIAIKILKEEHQNVGSDTNADRSATQRFIEEAQITGQLQHPNIVPVHEIGYDASGRLYFTMKRVEGQTLGEIMDQMRAGDQATLRKYTHHRLIEIYIKICDAIRFAHANDVLHRDIKPDNIMVGRFGEVQVMDWGLAKVIKGRQESDALESVVKSDAKTTFSGIVSTDGGSPFNTIDGTISGTPAYMPPEQARGETAKIDQRTDVFLLGALLYELITLIPPFTAESSMAALRKAQSHQLMTPKFAVQEACENGCLEDDSDFPPAAQERAKAFPQGLAEIAMHALAERNQDRYQSVKDLVDDVRAWRTDGPISVYVAPLWTRLLKWATRHRAAAFAIVAIAIVILLSLSAFGLIRQRVLQRDADHLQSQNDTQEQLTAQANELARREGARAEAEAENLKREQKRFQLFEMRDESKNLLNSASNVLWRTSTTADQGIRHRGMLEALRFAELARKADPNHPAAFTWLGNISFDLGRIVEARRYLLLAIEKSDQEGTSMDFPSLLTTAAVVLSEGGLFMIDENLWIPRFVEIMQRASEAKNATPAQKALANLFVEHMPRLLSYNELDPTSPKRESLAVELRRDAAKFVSLRNRLESQAGGTYWELTLMAAWDEVQEWRYTPEERAIMSPQETINRAKALVSAALAIRPQLPVAMSLMGYLQIEEKRREAVDSTSGVDLDSILAPQLRAWDDYAERFPFDSMGHVQRGDSQTKCLLGMAKDRQSYDASYLSAIQFAPKLSYAYAAYAEALERDGNRNRAAEIYQAARGQWRPAYDFPVFQKSARGLWRTPLAKEFAFVARGPDAKPQSLIKLYEFVLSHSESTDATKDYYSAVLLEVARAYQLVDAALVEKLRESLPARSEWVKVVAIESLALLPSEAAKQYAQELFASFEHTPPTQESTRASLINWQHRQTLLAMRPTYADQGEEAKGDLLSRVYADRYTLSVAQVRSELINLRDRYLKAPSAAEKAELQKAMIDLFLTLVGQDPRAAQDSCETCRILEGMIENYLKTPGAIGHSGEAR